MRTATSMRARKLADTIMRELGEMLATEVADPRLDLVTVSGVRMNADISIAEVLVTCGGGHACETTRQKEVLDGLHKARGFLRARLAKRLASKKVPDLRFRFDDYLEEMIYES